MQQKWRVRICLQPSAKPYSIRPERGALRIPGDLPGTLWGLRVMYTGTNRAKVIQW